MKKYTSILITGVFVSAILVGCGGGSKNYASAAKAESASMYESDDMYYSKDYAASEEAMDMAGGSSNGIEKVDDSQVENSNRKIIKNVNIDAETEEFDAFIKNVEFKVNALGGYLESTNISGRSINASKSSMRNANITARIPSNNLDNFITNVTENSNILNKSESAEDVTLSYADTEAHIKSLRTEQERLDELLLQADDIETIIAIESRITDVRYELESYESRLRSIDNKVDYSTVYINVREVERYTPVEVPKQSVGERIIIGFTENLVRAKDFIVDFFVEFVIAIPILLVIALFIAVPVIIVIIIVRFIIGLAKGKEYREKRKSIKAEKKANKLNKKTPTTAESSKASATDNNDTDLKDTTDNK
ncbi:MAG: DUF4349 domain-containing protein [Lachnospiraceae bacterium]|nr:DUF4349 domain-containing protein [Lachnospiraceae bacterium]